MEQKPSSQACSILSRPPCGTHMCLLLLRKLARLTRPRSYVRAKCTSREAFQGNSSTKKGCIVLVYRSTSTLNHNKELPEAWLAAAANIPWVSGMVPTICSYKWHSNGLKARILGEVFYCLYSIFEACRLGHTKLSTVVFWVKKRTVAFPTNHLHRPPFLKRLLILRAWFTPTTCSLLGACAEARSPTRHIRRHTHLDNKHKKTLFCQEWYFW